MFISKKELEKEVEQLKREVKSLTGLVFALNERLVKLEGKEKVQYFK